MLLAALSCTPDPQEVARALDAGRIEEADRLSARLLAARPDDTVALGVRIRLLAAERRTGDAIPLYHRYVEIGQAHSSGLLLGLLNASFGDSSPAVVVTALAASGLLSIDTVLGEIVNACCDGHPWVRQTAIQALGYLPMRPASLGRLAWGGWDEEDCVRIATVDAFIRMRYDGGDDLTRICQYTDNDYLIWRLLVLHALSEQEVAVSRVRELLGSRFGTAAVQAADCLVRLGERRHLKLIARNLRSDDAATRWSAVTSLGELGAHEYRDDIVAALADTAVRRSAIRALGELGDASVLSALVGFLSDSRVSVRTETILAVSRLAGAKAIPLVEPLLTDSAVEVRTTAVAALYVLTRPDSTVE